MTDVATHLETIVTTSEQAKRVCEDPGHKSGHPADAAKHADGDEKMVMMHPPCGRISGVIVLCQKYIEHIYTTDEVQCRPCGGNIHLVRETITVLGPAN